MKLLQYCQHVLGIGHLYRSLEISRAFSDHEVVLVTGGPAVAVPLPANVREYRLPPLMMDNEFSGLQSLGETGPVAAIKAIRQEQLARLYESEKPDVFLVELYPFGRKAFRFELDPLLEGIRDNRQHPCLVFCSLRDILVEKNNPEKHERRAVETLNRLFDGLLVHADPAIMTLDKTFSHTNDIAVPVFYTGFVCRQPERTAKDMRQRLNLSLKEKLVIASAGGGKVGAPLLTAVIAAVQRICRDLSIRLHVFTGPFLEPTDFEQLLAAQNERIQVERFTTEFLSYLSAADLSISMAGYNTCMNILATGVPALVWPFPQNQEQGLRAEALARQGAIGVLSDRDLPADRLAERIRLALSRERPSRLDIRLDGAAETRLWIEKQLTLPEENP